MGQRVIGNCERPNAVKSQTPNRARDVNANNQISDNVARVGRARKCAGPQRATAQLPISDADDADASHDALVDEIRALRRELREAQSPSLLIDVDELARLLNVDERTLRRLRAGNEIPRPVALSGHPKWRRAEIQAFVGKLRPLR
jgi:predicted DNA-binding transcriptional regulator AlpA